jgi:hypothetical protein
MGNAWNITRRAAGNAPQSNSNSNMNSAWQNNPSQSNSNPNMNSPWQNNPSQSNSNHNMNSPWQNRQNNPSQSNSNPNMNSPWQNNPSQSHASAINNTWQAIQHAAPPMQSGAQPMQPSQQQHQNAVRNVWNQAGNASTQRAGNLWNAFNTIQQPTGNFNQPPRNQEAVHDFSATRNASMGMNQPNSAIANVWNRVENSPNYAPRPSSNPPWNKMQSQPSGMNSSWNQMSGGSAGQSSQQPLYSPRPAGNSPWNQMQQGPNQSQNFNYSQPPMSGLPQRVNTNAPPSFSSVLSQAHQQHVPFAGAS